MYLSREPFPFNSLSGKTGRLGNSPAGFMKENSPEVLWKKGFIQKLVPKSLLKRTLQILEFPVSKPPFFFFFLKISVLGYAHISMIKPFSQGQFSVYMSFQGKLCSGYTTCELVWRDKPQLYRALHHSNRLLLLIKKENPGSSSTLKHLLSCSLFTLVLLRGKTCSMEHSLIYC